MNIMAINMTEKLKIIDRLGVEFDAEITISEKPDKNGPVVCKDVRIKVTPESNKVFSGMKFGRVVTFVREDGTLLEVYKSFGTTAEFFLSTHQSE